MKVYALTLIFWSAIGLIFPASSSACACCAEPGQYLLRTVKTDAYTIELLEKMKFDRAANLFMSEAGFDGIKGLDNIAKSYESQDWTASPEFFSLTNAFAAKTWRFNFKTKDGVSGSLALPVPTQMLPYKADIHDDKTSGGGGPLLYKEWRFKGNVETGNGFFKPSIVKPTTYFLVLQGRGNGCDNAEDFTHWRLEINGKKAEYEFFGELSSGKLVRRRIGRTVITKYVNQEWNLGFFASFAETLASFAVILKSNRKGRIEEIEDAKNVEVKAFIYRIHILLSIHINYK